MADIAAKLALFLPITSMKILADEFIPGISKFCMNEWERERIYLAITVTYSCSTIAQ